MSLRDDCDKNFVEEINRSLASTIRKCDELARSDEVGESNIKLIELYTAVTPERKQGKFHAHI